MLRRRARAYSSSCSQVILIYLYSFRRSSPLCSQKSPKITKNSYFRVHGQSKVINVDNPKKLVASACYVKQHVCACLQLFSR